MILAGRALNDSMASQIKNQVLTLMMEKQIPLIGSRILIMGLTFKENCPDIRNSKVVDLVEEFNRLKCSVDVYDPWADKVKCKDELDISPIDFPEKGKYSVIILAVAHDQFKELSSDEIRSFGQETNVVYDLKYLLKPNESDGRI
jgi:UDP-N-acetyl-D-galactosamine dehydrogenase